ncbi:nucleoside-diphosphate-sugar epimerase [Kineococcus xinjiangensis]|uniref:Nucleoside-diphosphate-sugar epimerase n=1 Tax=Kineococcus xinjiangensis TaxID=512762 RepID=A0A2S6IUY2_9ACTN|nr:NAD-dependent epimerase/dehydratase family protein [Kineococcus xinjiangensis]PPK98071.1 nucleoside-diphosphate-sugar epimerase [Kineococcus xinjiangensis]
MRLLVLGGTRFVGRALVAEALVRGWDVTALHRGVTGNLPPGVRTLHADRGDPAVLAAALGPGEWDAVADTWSGAPAVATLAARALSGRAGRYGYVSSGSVYTWGQHVDEGSPLVDGDPDAVDGEYAALKRGAELGVLQSFPAALLARAGLVLGPHEDIGRLPWWLRRTARGGRIVAPGRPGRPLQFVDVRDLAAWMLSGLGSGLTGPVDVASRPGHATTGELLGACVRVTGSDADLVWIPEAELEAAGAQPWTHLPCWVPEAGEFSGFFAVDTARAAATGLVCRPVAETVADTWDWMRREGVPPQRADRDVHGLPAKIEEELLSRR